MKDNTYNWDESNHFLGRQQLRSIFDDPVYRDACFKNMDWEAFFKDRNITITEDMFRSAMLTNDVSVHEAIATRKGCPEDVIEALVATGVCNWSIVRTASHIPERIIEQLMLDKYNTEEACTVLMARKDCPLEFIEKYAYRIDESMIDDLENFSEEVFDFDRLEHMLEVYRKYSPLMK
jgi:hypothetical protein